jgi:hypothetical protein
LERLLQLVAEGGLHSYEDLGRRLSISQPLLGALVEELARLGYLHPIEEGCGGRCAGCAVGSCSVVGPGHLWALTDKGKRAAARLLA